MRLDYILGQANYALVSFGLQSCPVDNSVMAYDMFRTRLGAAIRRHRKERELTQVQLAEKVGIDQANITRLERGKQGFDSETIFNIAQALDCTLTELFAEVEQVRAPNPPKDALAVAQAWQRLPKGMREEYKRRLQLLAEAHVKELPGDEPRKLARMRS